jgi:hypothetical protein
MQLDAIEFMHAFYSRAGYIEYGEGGHAPKTLIPVCGGNRFLVQRRNRPHIKAIPGWWRTFAKKANLMDDRLFPYGRPDSAPGAFVSCRLSISLR